MLVFTILTILFITEQINAQPPPIGQWNFDECSFNSPNGKFYNFSSLASLSPLTWSQTINDVTNGAGLYQLMRITDQNTVKLSLELGICRAVASGNPNCTNSFSAVNMIDSSGNCKSLGDVRVASMDVAPFKNGVMITYNHGDPLNTGKSNIDHTNNYSSILYLECGAATDPVLEHQLWPSQFHLSMSTPFACSKNYLNI